MGWTDDPIGDFLRYENRVQRMLKKRPHCTVCGEHIQDEMAYHLKGQWFCEGCVTDSREVVPDGS